jgi:predicted transcriptional regulator
MQHHMNYFPDLEQAAEDLWRDAQLKGDDVYPRLIKHLKEAHGVKVRIARSHTEETTLRRFDPDKKILAVSELLPTRSRKMQLACQIGLLSLRSVLDRLTSSPLLTTDDSRSLARAALANYFAAAVLMPYDAFLQAAQEQRYDLDVIGRRFGVGFEQVAHRVTTLRKPRAERSLPHDSYRRRQVSPSASARQGSSRRGLRCRPRWASSRRSPRRAWFASSYRMPDSAAPRIARRSSGQPRFHAHPRIRHRPRLPGFAGSGLISWTG